MHWLGGTLAEECERQISRASPVCMVMGTDCTCRAGPGATRGVQQGSKWLACRGAIKEAGNPQRTAAVVQMRSEAARAKSSSDITCSRKPSLVPGSGQARSSQLPLPEHPCLHILLCYQFICLSVSSTTTEARAHSLNAQSPAQCVPGSPSSHVSPSLRDSSHGDKEGGASRVDTKPQ